MTSLMDSLAAYRLFFSKDLLCSVSGQKLSDLPGDILRRQLTALRARHSEGCPHIERIDRWLSVDLADDRLFEVQAAAMMFVVEEVHEWLLNVVLDPPQLMTVRQLVTLTTTEFKFECQFDASIALYVLAATGLIEGMFSGVSAN